MAPVDPEVLISNVKPLSLIGAQLGGVVALIATITRFYFTAHRNLPPAQHTRSRHALEHDSLSTFLALGSLCTLVSVFAKINWLAASFYEWLHQTPSYPNLYPKLVNMGLPSYRHLTDGTLPLGLWWQDASVLNQYFYGILANPTNFFFAFQNFAGLAVFSLFVGIEGRHRNIPIGHLLSFIMLGQVVGLSAAMNFFFAALCLVPVPLGSSTLHQSFPGTASLLVPTVLSMACLVSVPAFLDNPFWPIACYVAYTGLPLVLGAVPQMQLDGSGKSTTNAARKMYAFVFRCLTLNSFLLNSLEVAGVFYKTHKVAVKPSHQHSHVWLFATKQDGLSITEQVYLTFGRFFSALDGGNPVISGILWDVLLSAITLSLWAYRRNIEAKAILSCVGLATWDTDSYLMPPPPTPKLRSGKEEPPKRKRGRPRKNTSSSDDGNESHASSDYIPTPATRDSVAASEPLALTVNWDEENTESGALAWFFSLVGGLPTALSAVLGGQLAGG